MDKHDVMYCKKVKIQHNILLFLFVYSFLFTDFIKEIIFHSIHLNTKLAILPVLLILCLSTFYRRNNWVLTLVLFILIYSILGAINYNYSISSIRRFCNTILIPILLITINIYEPKILFEKILKIMNIIVVVYIFLGIVDYLTNGIIRSIMINILKTSHFATSMKFDILTGSYRWFSLFGHPLVNTVYIIIFTISNILFVSKYNKYVYYNIYFVYLISIIGMLLSNSKSGLIIMSIILILNITNEKRKILYISIIGLFVIFAINSSYFKNNVITRFEYAINSGDITNGRATVLNELLYRNMYKLDVFIGKGMSSSDELVRQAFGVSGLTNMEIPFLMFLYEYGIFATLVIYFIMYIYPSFILLKRKKIYIFILFSLLFAFLNTFNGIATGTGVMLLFCYIIMIYLNVAIDNKRGQEYKYG